MDKNLLKALGLLLAFVAIIGVFLYISVNSAKEKNKTVQEQCVKDVQKKYNISDEQLMKIKSQDTDGVVPIPKEAIDAYKRCVQTDSFIQPSSSN